MYSMTCHIKIEEITNALIVALCRSIMTNFRVLNAMITVLQSRVKFNMQRSDGLWFGDLFMIFALYIARCT